MVRRESTRTASNKRKKSGGNDAGLSEPKPKVSVAVGTLEVTPPVPVTPEIEAEIAQFEALYPFEFDQFQRDAIATLMRGDSVLVAAPTGTGKTVVAEYGIYSAFRRSGRVLYTTPIKALSNQKYRDLRQSLGDEVGLLTGDVTENRDARVLVMTTEILRNMLLQTPWELDSVDCVIFDEVHYLADQERGTTWEEAIILCPEHVQLICLSATVSNADEIAGWISRTHRAIRLVTHVERSVPLSLYYFVDSKLHQVVDHNGAMVRDFPHTGGEARRQAGRGNGGNRRRAEYDEPGMDEPQPHEIVDALGARDMLPAIYFLFSRNDCQVQAERLVAMRPHLVTALQEQMIESVIEQYLKSLRPEDRELDQVKLIISLVRRGVGFHHAGLLPILKQLVEVLFSKGLLVVVFATDTLALGVNMPARAVVVGRMTKWDGRRRRVLLPNEFQQMAGRAGRRGMDAYGHVVVPYSPWISFSETLNVATGALEPVRSAFAVRYNTVLNLWDPPEGDRVRNLLHQSLAQYQSSQRIRQLEDDIIETGGDIAGVPKGCLIGQEDGDALLEDFVRLESMLATSEQKTARLERQLAELHLTESSEPWPIPPRQTVRRIMKQASPGLVVHHELLGWGVYLGKATTGIGSFLFAKAIAVIDEYRMIDYLPDRVVVDLPDGLADPPNGVVNATELVTARQLQRVWSQVKQRNLPDLQAMRAEFQRNEATRLAAERLDYEVTLAESERQVEALREARERHVCTGCSRRLEHLLYLDQVVQLDRERALLEEILVLESEAEGARIRGVMRGIREILHRFNYLHRGFPTAKADMLASVFDNDGLILCEVIDRGLLDGLAAEDVAEVFSWFSFDRDFRYANHFTLSDRQIAFRQKLEDVEHAVLGEERDNKIFVSEGHNPTFYGAAKAWCRGESLVEISRQIELSEGDLVMTFNKTLDLMRQIREMLQDVRPDSDLIGVFYRAEHMMMRDIVQQSLSLGFAPLVEGEGIVTTTTMELPLSPIEEPETEPVRRRRAPRSKQIKAAD